MNENFKKLIGLLELKDIKLADSHETVLLYPKQDDKEISIHGEQLFPKDDPKNSDDLIIFRPKFIFSFSIGENTFYRCEYILLVISSIPEDVKSAAFPPLNAFVTFAFVVISTPTNYDPEKNFFGMCETKSLADEGFPHSFPLINYEGFLLWGFSGFITGNPKTM